MTQDDALPSQGAKQNRLPKLLVRGTLGCGCGFFLLVLIAAIFAPKDFTPDQNIAGSGSAKTNVSASTQSPAPTPDPLVAARADFLRYYEGFTSAADSCDKPNRALSDRMQLLKTGGTSAYELYALAKRASEACGNARSAIYDLPTPSSIPESLKSAMNRSVDACRATYFSRARDLERAQVIFDGDTRPSKVAEYSEGVDGTVAAMAVCVTGLQAIALELKIPKEQLH